MNVIWRKYSRKQIYKTAEISVKSNRKVRFCPMEITKDTIIGDILDFAPETAPAFFEIGMHCLGCPSSRGESVEMACMVHGVDVDAFLKFVNSLIKEK